MIGVILIVMQLPLVMIDLKRDERALRHDAAVTEVTTAWGGRQTVTGPVLVVPVMTVSVDGNRRVRDEIRLTPAVLNVEADIEPKLLARGIYQARVFTARLKLSGRFELEKLAGDNRVIFWEEARLIAGVSDSRGLRAPQSLRWQGQAVALVGGTGVSGWNAGLKAGVPVDGGLPAEFELDLVLNGSGSLAVVPVAAMTRVELSSPWHSPSFQGAFLPTDRTVDSGGFTAEWEIGELGRNLPESWLGSVTPDAQIWTQMQDLSFGVNLLPAVGDYRTIERAIKYGALFFATVFAGFFLFEVTGGRALHGLNYLLVGTAVCLFYLALLALAEFWSFGAAYSTAAGAATGMILLYAKAVLKDGRRLGVMSGILGGIFGYLYLVLQMEDLSLVAGSLLLFVLLGAIMYATRNLTVDQEGKK
jgi:inner membrane protein